MIYLNSGTPGSGKSLNVARDIMRKLRRGQNVICNFPINMDVVKYKPSKIFILKILRIYLTIRHRTTIYPEGAIYKIYEDKLRGKLEYNVGKFLYIDNSKLNPTLLVCFAKHNHKKGREGQTLIVIDECPVIFNPRDYNRNDRPKWIKFFQLHRHLGYNAILIAQNDRLIDRQIRSFIEYNCKHRKVNNFRTLGMIISLLQLKMFCVVTYWYGVNEKCGIEFFLYKKMYSQLYDSYSAFDRDLNFSL